MPQNKHKHDGKNKRKGQNRDLYAQPLTRKDIRKEVHAAARAQYGPIQRQLSAEKRASRLQEAKIGGYFRNYDTSLDEAAARAAQSYATAGSQIAQTAQGTADYAERLRQQLAKEGQADAQLRGATYEQSPLAAAELARMNSANVLSDVNAAQGAATGAYFASKKGIGKRESIEQRLREARSRRSISQEQRDTKRDVGAFQTEQRANIIDRERDYLLGVQAANLDRRGQKIDARQAAASLAETRAHNAATEATAAKNAATSAASQRDLARDRRYDRRHPHAGSDSRPGHDAQQDRRANQRLTQELYSALVSSSKWNGAPIPKDPSARYRFFLQHRDEIIANLMQKSGDPSHRQAAQAFKRYIGYLQRRFG